MNINQDVFNSLPTGSQLIILNAQLATIQKDIDDSTTRNAGDLARKTADLAKVQAQIDALK